MANTIAKATGGDATREKTTTRLGSRYASAQANTWRTFATVTTWADGRVQFEVTRDGKRLCSVNINGEDAGFLDITGDKLDAPFSGLSRAVANTLATIKADSELEADPEQILLEAQENLGDALREYKRTGIPTVNGQPA